MENNTFTTTVYAQTPAARAFEYLRRLQNLDEWTLGSRMLTRIDDDTFMGTASGYQTMLCYHVRTLEHPRFAAIEWQCGYRYREYFKQYPCSCFRRSMRSARRRRRQLHPLDQRDRSGAAYRDDHAGDRGGASL